jgi:two-component system, NtrC family, sensor histidine kinase KinB
MIGIRQRIMIGFGSLLAVIAVIGVMTMEQIRDLGQTLDIILRENYRSVIACQDMKESLERIDSGILFTLTGKDADGNDLIKENSIKFQKALDVELNNITIPGEGEKAQNIEALFRRYMNAVPLATQNSHSLQERDNVYFTTVMPLFYEIKNLAQEVLTMNQTNMSEAKISAQRLARETNRRMGNAILVSAFLALLFSYLARKWILRPINRMIESTMEIRRGNFDVVLETGPRDEIGRLSESFNEMTSALRQVRREDRAALMRTSRATEEVFKVLPEAVAVFDLEGRVQISTETANRAFGLKPGILAADLDYAWLPLLIQKAVIEERSVELDSKNAYIQQFINNREFFFQPVAIPLSAGPDRDELTGVALIFKDVTQVHEQRELKRGVLSTVLHQLKTPLTSLRLSVHLLLEERVGTLTGKQTELLVAAKEDSERLVNILDDLLDLNRIESGKSHISPAPVLPRNLIQRAVESFQIESRDKGVGIVNSLSYDLPEVMADSEKIGHVFGNLISNALRYTTPGGTITISAKSEPDYLRFSVEDTGKGIPAEHLVHIFEPFYRVPGQVEKSGVGLGLAIVKEIVEAHGGKVGAESKVGKGSVFYFTLPFFVG